MFQDTVSPPVVTAALSWRELLLPLLPVVQAQLTMPLVEAIKRLNAWTGTRPAWQKQLLVVALNALFATLGVFVGVSVPGIDNVTTGAAAALIGSALSFALHAGQTAKDNKLRITELQRVTGVFPAPKP